MFSAMDLNEFGRSDRNAVGMLIVAFDDALHVVGTFVTVHAVFSGTGWDCYSSIIIGVCEKI